MAICKLPRCRPDSLWSGSSWSNWRCSSCDESTVRSAQYGIIGCQLTQSLQHAQKNQNIDWSLLWQHYHQLRHSSTQFYQFSSLLTPLYQSDQWWAGGLRDLVFPWMYQIPIFEKKCNHNFRLKTAIPAT